MEKKKLGQNMNNFQSTVSHVIIIRFFEQFITDN